MEQLKRFRVPVFIGVGFLVVALIIFAAWISPEGSHLKKLQAEQDERLREALEAREAERRGWPIVPRGGAAPGSEPKQPKTFEEAKASMMARLDRM